MLDVTSQDGTTVLQLDHGKANALDLDLSRGLKEALVRIEQDDHVRAVVLTGTGSIFCAGVDLFRLLDGGAPYVDEFLPAFMDMFTALFSLPRPVVAAINGHAIAGGCVLAAACDYRMMARAEGTIGVPELKVGLPFPLSGIEILRFATSEAHLQELVYRGKTYNVDEAYERGLVDELVDPAELLDRSLEVAAQLSKEPSARFRITKRQLRTPALQRIAQHEKETEQQVFAAWKDPVTIEAIRAYVEGMRKP